MPHVPQFLPSDWVSTQLPEQACSGSEQATLQSPCEQTVPASQAWSQAPQLVALLTRSMQTVPHSVCPSGQTQTPWEQNLSAEQALSQVPQWLSLDCRSTQSPEQEVSGSVQPRVGSSTSIGATMSLPASTGASPTKAGFARWPHDRAPANAQTKKTKDKRGTEYISCIQQW